MIFERYFHSHTLCHVAFACNFLFDEVILPTCVDTRSSFAFPLVPVIFSARPHEVLPEKGFFCENWFFAFGLVWGLIITL